MELILALFSGGCTFVGAYLGVFWSVRAARKEREKETKAKRVALLATLRKKLDQLQDLLTVGETAVPPLLPLSTNSLAPLLDGTTLSYQHDAALISALLALETALLFTHHSASYIATVELTPTRTEEQMRAVAAVKREVAEALLFSFKQVTAAMDESKEALPKTSART